MPPVPDPEVERKTLFPVTQKEDGLYNGNYGEYIPRFLLPIHDNNGAYPYTAKGTHRNIIVYWDDVLGGLSFLYPCGDTKMFDFNAEQSFDDFIEAIIELEQQARARHQEGAQLRLTADLRAQLQQKQESINELEEGITNYNSRIESNTNRREETADRLDIRRAEFDEIQASIHALENPQPKPEPEPETVTNDD